LCIFKLRSSYLLADVTSQFRDCMNPLAHRFTLRYYCKWERVLSRISYKWYNASAFYSYFVGDSEILLRWIVSSAHFYKLFDFTKVCIRLLIGTYQRRINRRHLFTPTNAHSLYKIKIVHIHELSYMFRRYIAILREI
jgi:hypothetical protein